VITQYKLLLGCNNADGVITIPFTVMPDFNPNNSHIYLIWFLGVVSKIMIMIIFLEPYKCFETLKMFLPFPCVLEFKNILDLVLISKFTNTMESQKYFGTLQMYYNLSNFLEL
jgi:hypothetical protein